MTRRGKNLLFIAVRLTAYVCCLFLISIITIFLWFKYAWPGYIDKGQVTVFTEEINNSRSMPGNFYSVYDKLYPNQRHTRIIKTYTIGSLRILLTSKDYRDIMSPTMHLSQRAYINIDYRREMKIPWASSVYLSFALDRYTTPEKCFDYYVNNYEFLYNQKGIDNASSWYYKKTTGSLTDTEIIGLIILMENPVLYDPIRSPERYERRVNELMNRR